MAASFPIFDLIQKSGDVATAETEYLRAIELSPSFAGVREWYGDMLLQYFGRAEEALKYLREAAADLPDNTAVALNLARALAQTGQTEAARRN